MPDAASRVPGLAPHAVLANREPESIDELRALMTQVATALDELTQSVRNWQASAGDDAFHLHARIHELEHRIRALESEARSTPPTKTATNPRVADRAQVAEESPLGTEMRDEEAAALARAQLAQRLKAAHEQRATRQPGAGL